mmetsp:Transcript_9455/g.22053  ORF Transcript_9455/g.22053 Transcript_9455/m.22053 type:complete len:231 (-) Transcript_9455:231-923(-)
MFPGGVQDRLRARAQDQIGGYKQRSVPLNVSGHPEAIRDYSSTCHHVTELKQKAKRISALERQLQASEDARSQLVMDVDVLKDKLDQAVILRKRNEAVIESQQLAIRQLQAALLSQQKAVETIFGEAGDLQAAQAEIQATQTSMKQVLAPRAPAAQPAPGPAQVVRPPPDPATYRGFSVFGGDKEETEDGSEESEESIAAPTAKLFTPGTTPRTNASSPRTASPAVGGFI